MNDFLSTILLSVVIDPILVKLVILSIGIIIVGFVLKLLKQPYIIAYILAGVIMGPFGFEIVTDEVLIDSLGSLGLVLLLFFIGMEISLPQLISNWKISVYGTLVQVVISVAVVYAVGVFLDWPIGRVIMLGFVISLSSTAVVIKLLQDRNETTTRVGQNVISILLAQDIIIVPMMIILSYLSGEQPATTEIIKQLIGAAFIIGIVLFVLKKKNISLPFDNHIKKDHEIQVFIAIAICFGFSIITAYFGLSSALGAFVAGILISSANATKWVNDSLHAFRVVFVALFFVSVGMLIDLEFLKANLLIILFFVFLVFLVNNLINALIIKAFKVGWKESIYTGAILAQVGEFSFVIGSSGYASGIITDYGYQLIISIISISLMISPMWIVTARKLFMKNKTLD